MTLTIKAEATTGDSVEVVAREMVALAERTLTYVEVQFNSVTLLANSSTDSDLLAASFYRALKMDRPGMVATGWRGP